MQIPAAVSRNWLRPAVIVAESLRRIPAPPFATLPPFHDSAGEVASAIARSLAPPAAPDEPPAWLLPSQRVAFARALAAVGRFGGVLVAEPVGSGKTWIGLALAQAQGGRAVAIVPAAVRDQWRRAAGRTGIELTIQTHEQWSRGSRAIPHGLVLIDEAHRFRNPDIHRYDYLAPALNGRNGVLLTATPVVNELLDAANQLLLLVRDDALAGAGVPSIREALQERQPPPQLADLIICSARQAGRPREAVVESQASVEEDDLARSVLLRLDRLQLSSNGAVRGLIRGVLAAAWSSSAAALRAALIRYRALLLQSRDAGNAGVTTGRRDLIRLLGTDMDQTVLWPLMEPAAGSVDLLVDDLPVIDDCLAWLRELDPSHDPKARRLAGLVGDEIRTLVFTNARATVSHLRRVLTPPSRIAWCTGSGAGIGPSRLAREDVLRWFAPGEVDHPLAPRILLATEVAAEGLDLQRAGRIVHYDLPWTTVRMDQRAGRIIRIGSVHASAEVVSFLPPRRLEERLGILKRLALKRPLPGRVGLGPEPDAAWRWRSELAERWKSLPAAVGCAVVSGEYDAAVVGVELVSRGRVLAAFALGRRGRTAWTSDPPLMDQLLSQAMHGPSGPDDPAAFAAVAGSLRRAIRAAVLGATGSLWRIRPLGRWARPALARLRVLAAEAVRRRDATSLAFVDRGISFLRRGHTAGERYLATRLAEASDETLVHLLGELPPPDPLPAPVEARIIGAIIVKRERQAVSSEQ
jgi:hypothetical protein